MIEHRSWHWFLLVVVFCVVCVAGIASGAVAVPVSDVIRAIGGRGDDSVIAIVRNLRLPRVALAALISALWLGVRDWVVFGAVVAVGP